MCQDDRQLSRCSRIRHLFDWIVPLQGLTKEEPYLFTACGLRYTKDGSSNSACAVRLVALKFNVSNCRILSPEFYMTWVHPRRLELTCLCATEIEPRLTKR